MLTVGFECICQAAVFKLAHDYALGDDPTRTIESLIATGRDM